MVAACHLRLFYLHLLHPELVSVVLLRRVLHSQNLVVIKGHELFKGLIQKPGVKLTA
jgi:hypothetical protein